MSTSRWRRRRERSTEVSSGEYVPHFRTFGKKWWKRQPIIKYLNNSNFSAKLIRRLSLRPTPEELEERNVLKSKLFIATLSISSQKNIEFKVKLFFAKLSNSLLCNTGLEFLQGLVQKCPFICINIKVLKSAPASVTGRVTTSIQLRRHEQKKISTSHRDPWARKSKSKSKWLSAYCPQDDLEESMHQIWEIHVTIWRNPWISFDIT